MGLFYNAPEPTRGVVYNKSRLNQSNGVRVIVDRRVINYARRPQRVGLITEFGFGWASEMLLPTRISLYTCAPVEWKIRGVKIHVAVKHCSVLELQCTHTRLTAPFPGLPRSAGTRKVKPIWILLKQETVCGSGISCAICKSAPRSRQITTPAPHHSVFLQAGCPSCRPTNSVKALKAQTSYSALDLIQFRSPFQIFFEKDSHRAGQSVSRNVFSFL